MGGVCSCHSWLQGLGCPEAYIGSLVGHGTWLMGPQFLRAGLGLLVSGARAQESQACCQPTGGWTGNCHHRLKVCGGYGSDSIYQLVGGLALFSLWSNFLSSRSLAFHFLYKKIKKETLFLCALNSLHVYCFLFKSFK